MVGGVDALLGKQTREYADVDIIIQECDLLIMHEYLKERGFKPVPRDDTCAWNFVLGDDAGREVDVHVIVFDEHKNGVYGPARRGVMYPAESLTGVGEISGVAVRCLTAEYQLDSYTGYELKEKDRQDVMALCAKFSLELPEAYGV